MEQLILVSSMTFSVIIMFRSVKAVLHHPVLRERVIPFTNLIALFFIYITLISGFGLIYMSLSLLGFPILIENNELLHEPFYEMIQTTIYFSAVTLFSVGYGDITPIEIGRWIAIFEALLGYILPAIFVLSSFTRNKS